MKTFKNRPVAVLMFEGTTSPERPRAERERIMREYFRDMVRRYYPDAQSWRYELRGDVDILKVFETGRRVRGTEQAPALACASDKTRREKSGS